MNGPVFRVGLFLATRQLKRTSVWTTLLIIFVMTLTFLNLVIVSGILVGLVHGASTSNRTQYSGDVIISMRPEKPYIEESQSVIAAAHSLPDATAISARYLTKGVIEAQYRTKSRESDLTSHVNATIVGIDPSDENAVTDLSRLIIKGEYLDPKEDGYILLGKNLLSEYSSKQPGLTTLENVSVGDKVRVRIGTKEKEVIVKGIVRSKIDQVSLRAYLVDRELRGILNRTDQNVGEIAIRISPGASADTSAAILISQGVAENGLVQTWEEAQGDFFKNIEDTFRMLGNIIGAIGLVASSITIFIVIFINAVTRKKYIGILKGIGIDRRAIEFSYIIQSVFYALCGAAFGLLILYGILVPYFLAHPLDFPFSDGILVAPINESMIRAGVLLTATIIAGYIPARMIIKKNTLDAILGRA